MDVETSERELARFATLGRVTAGVLHDLRNYFMVLDLTLRRAEAGINDGTVRTHLIRARGDVDRAAALTTLLLSRVRGAEPDPVPIDLAPIVRASADVLARLLPTGIQLSVEVDEDLPPILGIAQEIDQLVLNLVVNAADAMTRGGLIRIALRAAGPSAVRLEVTDSGPGFTDELIGAKGEFTPSTKPGRRGHGLGLAIVRGVVERHRALLHYGSSPSGGGRVLVLFGRC